MARELGVSQKTYSRFESGGNNITVENINAIAVILETTRSQIMELDTVKIFDPLFPLVKNSSNVISPLSNDNRIIYSNPINDELIQSKNDLIDYLKNELSLIKSSVMNTNSTANGKPKKIVRLRIG